MKKTVIFKAAIIFAALFLSLNLLFSQNLLLLNTGRDYCYIFSVKEKKVLKRYKVCEKKASVTDIVPLKQGFLVIPHRIDLNIDAEELYVYNKDFSKILKKIPVAKSPYKAFFLGKDRVLVNHTFFSFERLKFVGEIVNLNSLKVEKTLYFDGIPANVVELFNKHFAVIEDVRGVLKGVRLVCLEDGERIDIAEPGLSSNIVQCNGVLYCAVNGFGQRGFANSLFAVYPIPMVTVYSSVEKIAEFKKFEFPFILGSFNSFLIIGFTNHSVKGNYNTVCLFNTETKKRFFVKSCFGPESMVKLKNTVFVAGMSSECLTIVYPFKEKAETIKISDTIPGFSSIRVVP